MHGIMFPLPHALSRVQHKSHKRPIPFLLKTAAVIVQGNLSKNLAKLKLITLKLLKLFAFRSSTT